MSAKVIDFYEGAARSLGYESFAALEQAQDEAFCFALEKAQTACTHPDKGPHSGMCHMCEITFRP